MFIDLECLAKKFLHTLQAVGSHGRFLFSLLLFFYCGEIYITSKLPFLPLSVALSEFKL